MFENLIMLAGLGGAVVPLVIHLLSRARYRTVPWGATMFLEGASPRRPYVGRMREWVLLGVRMSAVGLLAVALARPVAGELSAGAEPKRVAAVIVVDCSGSMSRTEAGQTRMTMARQAVLRILSSLRRGDQVALTPAGGETTAVMFTGDLQAVAARVNELKPSATSVDLAGAISAALDALQQHETVARRLYVVSDRQALSWSRIEDPAAEELRARVQQMRLEFVVMPVGQTDRENIAVESIEVLNPPAVAGCQAQVEIALRNHGTQGRWGLPLSVRLGAREVHARTINVPAEETVTVVAQVTMPPAGAHVLSAEVMTDGGDADSRLERVVEVARPLRVQVVREAGHDEVTAGTDYLAAALMPHRASQGGGADVADVEIVSYELWEVERLADYQVLVLDDVRALEPWEARAVEQFVYGGGGLLIAPGPATRIEEYNRLLYRDETGLLPALLQPPSSPQPALRIDAATVDAAHPLMRFAVGLEALPGTVQRFFPLTGRTATARVLATFGGEPFVMETPFGGGRVVLITCTLDARWSSIPLTSLYLPLMQSTIRYLAGANESEWNVAAGQELVATFSPALQSGRAAVLRPDGARDQAEVAQIDERSEVRYAQTHVPGIYVVRAGARGNERTATFAVMPARDESSVETLDEERWSALQRKLGFERVGGDGSAGAVADRAGSGWGWMTALVGVLALLVMEMALVRRWSMQGAT